MSKTYHSHQKRNIVKDYGAHKSKVAARLKIQNLSTREAAIDVRFHLSR
jgi:hypothetical protein